eukprot:IDg178t1
MLRYCPMHSACEERRNACDDTSISTSQSKCVPCRREAAGRGAHFASKSREQTVTAAQSKVD